MSIDKEIQKIILHDKKYILDEIALLKKELLLEKKIDSLIVFIDEMDSLFLTNLDIRARSISEQIAINFDKKLEMRCYIKGEKKFIKGFGKIGQIKIEKLNSIFKFINLIKLLKSMSESSFYASQYYRADKLFDELVNKGKMDD
ncbi:hypothetical protein [Sulfurimonas sp.]|uniref:hypothetical protein n=1 Tax=Sulfurimonas sp. TaxID=2022749 RepID=UPI0025D41ABE|nr:hypothetical protein [Sulfurimonas sp.]